MGIKSKMMEGAIDEGILEKLNEKQARADRFVEKWAKVPEIGSGLKAMDDRKARNLATMLEMQARHMSRLSEAQYSSAFSATPENMIRLVRLNISQAL